jgi:hypothetical protein
MSVTTGTFANHKIFRVVLLAVPLPVSRRAAAGLLVNCTAQNIGMINTTLYCCFSVDGTLSSEVCMALVVVLHQ